MIDQVIAYVDAHRKANVDRLCDLLRIPSISTDPARKADTRHAGTWVQRVFTDCGIQAELIDTPGHPCIVADTGPAGSGLTLLVYGHYDVQPTGDEILWDSPAFEPKERDGAIYARGAADDKGQVLAHLLAAEAWKNVAGKLPIRLKFLIEGEEEIGSPNLKKLLHDHRDRLACDYVAISDTPKFDDKRPAITYGTKGLVYKEIILTGPKQDLHSGSYGGTLPNPANVLANILASLRDPENRVTIPGFYDHVRELSKKERATMAKLPFDEKQYRKAIGVDALDGESGYTTLERKWARPTLDVNGLLSGFTGEGASTIIPAKAMAKVSMRLVPDQKHKEISHTFDDAVRAACPPGVKLQIKDHAHCDPYVSELGSPGMAAAAKAVERGFGQPPLFIREGGSLPILPLFKQLLGADSLMVGFCVPDCNAHGPNEFLHVKDFHDGTKMAAHLVQCMADVAK